MYSEFNLIVVTCLLHAVAMFVYIAIAVVV